MNCYKVLNLELSQVYLEISSIKKVSLEELHSAINFELLITSINNNYDYL